MFLNPKEILSPKGRVNNIDVLEETEFYTIVILEWDGKDSLAVRWNPLKEEELGTPASRGVPTWFILPESIAKSYLKENLSKDEIKNSLRALQLYTSILEK